MKERKTFIRKQQVDNRFASFKEGRIFELERAIIQGQSYDTVKKNIRTLMNGGTASEGNTFYIMFDPVLEKIGEKDESLLPRLSLDQE